MLLSDSPFRLLQAKAAGADQESNDRDLASRLLERLDAVDGEPRSLVTTAHAAIHRQRSCGKQQSHDCQYWRQHCETRSFFPFSGSEENHGSKS